MSVRSGAWTQSGAAALVLLVLAFVLYGDTLASMVAVWLRSDTFAHGAIVFPVCVWLAWRKRGELAALEPRASFASLLVLAALAAAWLLARLADVLVVEQLALVGMIPAIVWAVLGSQALAVLAFPLAFLIFAVPFGEGLIPILMEFTASFTVRALELTGIPVYRDGLNFSIPSGDFEVARACSGIRYLIASLALGTLYAHLTYHTLWRRALFIALAIVVPLLANGVRAYLIVMIAHLSEMRLAVGVDHLIYGWLFFGLVIFALFWAGLAFRERTPREPVARPAEARTFERPRTVAAALVAVAMLSAAPLAAHQLAQTAAGQGAGPGLPLGAEGWGGPLTPTLDWRPSFEGADDERIARYESRGGQVHVAIVAYAAQTQGAELVNSENLPYDGDWRLVNDARARAAVAGGASHTVRATRLQGEAGGLLVWHWYAVGAHATASEALAKLYQVWDVVRGAAGGATLIALATPLEPDAAGADVRLRDFVAAHGAALARCAQGADGECAP